MSHTIIYYDCGRAIWLLQRLLTTILLRRNWLLELGLLHGVHRWWQKAFPGALHGGQRLVDGGGRHGANEGV